MRSFSLVGFEELGNSDVFKTAVLELRLSQSGKFGLLAVDLIFLLLIYLDIGVLQRAENSLSLNRRGSAKDNIRKENEDDEEFDLDD